MRFATAASVAALQELLVDVDRRVSPDLVGLMRALARVAPDEEWSFDRIREDFESTTGAFVLPDGVEVAVLEVAGRPAELIVPRAGVSRSTVYLHGGAFTIGSIGTVRALAARYAVATKSRVLTVDYRLAPEHPYPAGLDDAVTTLGWLATESAGDALVVAGDSAGGGLAIATAIEAVRQGVAAPDAVVAMSPWTDLRLPHASLMAASEDPQAPHWLLERSAAAYRGSSPVEGDLSTLPPTLVQVGSAETLLDDATSFAKAAFAVAAPVTLEVWPGMPHVWHAFGPRLEAADEALARIDHWLTSALG